MKSWTKVSFDTLSDERIKALIRKEGMRGFGTYMLLFLYCDCYNGMNEETLELIGSRYSSRNQVSKILHDHDLFDIGSDGLVRACTRVGVRALARISTEAGALQTTDAGQCNSDIENKKETDSFLTGMIANYPNVMSMQRPLERHQYDKLVERFGEEKTVQTIRELENYPNINKKYVSAYFTLLKWCVPKDQR